HWRRRAGSGAPDLDLRQSGSAAWSMMEGRPKFPRLLIDGILVRPSSGWLAWLRTVLVGTVVGPVLSGPVLDLDTSRRNNAGAVVKQVQNHLIDLAFGAEIDHHPVRVARRPLASPAVRRGRVIPVIAIVQLPDGGSRRGVRRGDARVVMPVIVDGPV